MGRRWVLMIRLTLVKTEGKKMSAPTKRHGDSKAGTKTLSSFQKVESHSSRLLQEDETHGPPNKLSLSTRTQPEK
jgi:hypothetical protein